MTNSNSSVLEQLRAFDEQRPSIPGEHWFAFGIGLYLLTRRPRTTLGRLASMLAGGAFVARALTGRDGLIALLEQSAGETIRPEELVEVAAPWPYEERTRIAPPSSTR
jgi:hypothetical protein